MAHGAPDASNVINLGQDYRIDDMAELAARLGSLATYRRTGDVFFMEDFSYGLNQWHVFTRGADSEVVLSNHWWRSAGVAANLYVNDGVADYAGIWRAFLPSVDLTLGVTSSLAVFSDPASWHVLVEYNDGDNRYYTSVRYVLADSTLELLVAVDTWVVFASDVDISLVDGIWASVKLIVDFSRNKVVSFGVGKTTYDLGQYSLISEERDYAESYLVWFYVYGVAINNRSLFMDNIVLTRNEV